ncbi:hypothetical protein LINPERPRIM_LOCUS8907 [Linum perenne]
MMIYNVELNVQVNGSSIIVDASNYIQQLKQKIEKLNQEMDNYDYDQPSSSTRHQLNNNNGIPVVTWCPEQVSVETVEKGFVINVISEKKCEGGLLVSVLEAFEEIGLNVVEARVSCTDTFRLHAVAAGQVRNVQNEEEREQRRSNIDAQMVKRAVLEAIDGW